MDQDDLGRTADDSPMNPPSQRDGVGTVSVIIASNRGGPYLADAVESVRQQTVPVHEIILVDDGSPEPGLSQVARELGIDYVRQLASGVSAARNRGVARATGEWVALLDDDDIWHPEKVEEQLRALEASPESIACYTDQTIIDSLGSSTMMATAPVGSSSELIARGNGVPPSNTLLIRREAYITVGGCEAGLRFAEDIDLVLRLLRLGEFTKVDRALIGYRKYPGQVTNDGFASQAGYLHVVRRLIRRVERAGDHEMARLLRQHLERTLPGMAEWGAGELLSRMRHGRWRDAAATARWGFTHTRAAFPSAILRTAAGRLRGSRR